MLLPLNKCALSYLKVLSGFLPLFLFLSFTAKAQFSRHFTAGIRSGITGSTLAYLQHTDPDFGFQAAAIGSYRFSRLFGVAVEPGFAQQGGVVNSVAYRLNYFQSPVLLQAHLGQLVLEGGIYRGNLLHAKSRKNIFTEDASGYFSKTDGGFCLGALLMPENDFLLGVRYLHGIRNINNQLLTTGIIANRAVQIMGGYTFRVKRKPKKVSD